MTPDVPPRQKALSVFAIKCGFAVAAVAALSAATAVAAAAAAPATPIVVALNVTRS